MYSIFFQLNEIVVLKELVAFHIKKRRSKKSSPSIYNKLKAMNKQIETQCFNNQFVLKRLHVKYNFRLFKSALHMYKIIKI